MSSRMSGISSSVVSVGTSKVGFGGARPGRMIAVVSRASIGTSTRSESSKPMIEATPYKMTATAKRRTTAESASAIGVSQCASSN
eukprot:scaffold71463_cov62-Phaeocystis_antarctica.AAC.6